MYATSMTRAREEAGKPKVLLIDLGAHFGGVETYLLSLANLLASDIDLYALCVLPELATRLAKSGVTVTCLPAWCTALKPLRFLAGLLSVPVLLLRHEIETVQVNGLLESVLMAPARLLSRSAVYTRHGPFEIELYSWGRHPLKRLARTIARASVCLTTHVVCVSQSVAEGIKDLLPQTRYSVISNWVSGQEPFKAPQALTSPARVLCVSRLEHYKGVHLLIEAARRMPEIEVTIVGDGGDRISLESMAADLANVSFAGFQRNIQAFYQRADIFVMPSMGPEGLPITSLEAMARGLPCILSDLPVHHEITDDGHGALLFRSGDVDSLQTGLRTLLASAEHRQGYAAAAHRIIAIRYNENNVRQHYLRILSGERSDEYSAGFRRENASLDADLHPVTGE